MFNFGRGTLMKQTAVGTIQARPLTRKRLDTVPRRINGLYRLSITSREAFGVDIGGKWLAGVRTLDVFHEKPMFIDGLTNASAVDVLSSGRFARVVQIYPPGKPERLEFRITAHDAMAERAELENTKKLASLETPLVYEGFVKQSVHVLEDITSPEGLEETIGGAALDVAASVIAVGLVAAAGALLLIGPPGLGLVTLGTGGPACCPSRTYVNGKLFKNLKEVRVKLSSGRIIGYTSP